MISFIFRQFKRIAVLVPGLIMAYVGVHDIFPAVDRFVPSDALAIIATYVITAYVLIPALLRLLRLFFRPKHVPLYCTTPDGFASDPINIGVVGTKSQLIKAMASAGWYLADDRNAKNLFKMITAVVLKQRYNNAPFSSLYLFGRSQDLGFEIPLDSNPLHRHHVRFWAASHNADSSQLEHTTFWEIIHKSNLTSGRVLWVGAASLDSGFGIIGHNAQLTHRVHHDTDAERELITKQLKSTGLVKKIRSVTIGKPIKINNRVIRSYLRADGRLTICEL